MQAAHRGPIKFFVHVPVSALQSLRMTAHSGQSL